MSSRLTDLITLAREPSSERRRELLREVTDVFFGAPAATGSTELSLFDDVMSKLAGEMEAAVRAELAERMADAPSPPTRLVRNLAADAIEQAYEKKVDGILGPGGRARLIAMLHQLAANA